MPDEIADSIHAASQQLSVIAPFHFLPVAAAVLAVGIAFFIQQILTLLTPVNSHFLLLYPTVFIAAWRGGLWAGLTATVSAAFAGWYFALPVNRALVIMAPGDAAELAIFTLMGIGFTIASHRRQRARQAMDAARAATERAEARLRLLVQNAPVALWALDDKGRFTAVETGSFAVDFSKPEIQVGQNAFQVYANDQDNQTNIRRALKGESFTEETQLDDVWYATHYAPMTDTQGTVTGMLAVTTDITARKELELSQRKMIESLRQERDLREAFVSTLTHDLRTPLQAARMSAELLIRQPSDATRVVTLSARIADHIDRTANMIQGLLDAHRIGAGERLPLKIQHCQLRPLLLETLEEANTVHGDRCVLSLITEVEGYWDPDVLRRIVENLADNALKYGAAGTVVTVSVEEHVDTICLKVHNDGEPITHDEQVQLFTPFKRGASATTNGKRGWGVGLTFVRGAAEAHGGYVSVRSEAGHGTTFSVTLPKDARPWQSCRDQAQMDPLCI